jgi:hypothetical protein
MDRSLNGIALQLMSLVLDFILKMIPMKYFCFFSPKRPFLQFNGVKIKFFGSNARIDCSKTDTSRWRIYCEESDLKFNFFYTPYFFDSFDDDNETDVNFGLWLLELKKDPFRYDRVKQAFSSYH